jgi:phosphatidylserine/phosphatidylglycerophosphate/cardiolipin synthase-like enzyme
MNDAFSRLSSKDLRLIANSLRSGRLTLPATPLQIGRIFQGDVCTALATKLSELSAFGFSAEQVAVVIDSVLQDRELFRYADPTGIDLVTSGPEAPGITNRDTSVVVREMFAHAKQSVTVIGYAVYQGQKVFEALAHRMDSRPELQVELFFNISRGDGDTTKSEIIVSRYIERFKSHQWPKGSRLPVVYYDPRSVSDDIPIRSSLHAKCVVVDESDVFVSSANFTEAGQERNIEVGLRLDNSWLARKLVEHFKRMAETGQFRRAI